ncbi:MAG: DUF6671 family protein [Planctomycetota bacterium]
MLFATERVFDLSGRTACIATMHGKERVLAPRLQEALGLRCVVPDGLDTDRFGTFSGERPRTGTALDTARAKALAGIEATGLDLAIASEGSFVPHPEVPAVQLGIELVLLVDVARGLEIVGRDASLVTNHARARCRTVEEVATFGARIGFPGHGLVLVLGDPPRVVERDVEGAVDLERTARAILADAERSGLPLFAQSDMRAHRNPTRMRAIDRSAADLVARIGTPCPACGRPGFGRVDVVRGLPCTACGTPTRRPRAARHGCSGCAHVVVVELPEGGAAAEPADCPSCNP